MSRCQERDQQRFRVQEHHKSHSIKALCPAIMTTRPRPIDSSTPSSVQFGRLYRATRQAKRGTSPPLARVVPQVGEQIYNYNNENLYINIYIYTLNMCHANAYNFMNRGLRFNKDIAGFFNNNQTSLNRPAPALLCTT